MLMKCLTGRVFFMCLLSSLRFENASFNLSVLCFLPFSWDVLCSSRCLCKFCGTIKLLCVFFFLQFLCVIVSANSGKGILVYLNLIALI